MPTYQGGFQYQPRYGFRYLKQPDPAPPVSPIPTIGSPIPGVAGMPAPPTPAPESQAQTQSDDDGDSTNNAPNPVRYNSFSDAFKTISGQGNYRADPLGGGTPTPATSARHQRDPLGGGFSKLGSIAGAGAGALVGRGIGGTLGNLVLPGLGGFIGGQLGSQFGGGFDQQEEVPQIPAAATAIQEGDHDPFGTGFTYDSDLVQAETQATQDSYEQEAYGGGNDEPAPVSTNATARLDDDDSDSGRFGSGTGGQAQSGEFVSSSHDWSASPVAQQEDNDSGGGGGGK